MTNLAFFLEESASEMPSVCALRTPGGEVTFAELQEAASSTGSRLLEAGLEPGGRVAVWTDDPVEFAVALYGTWYAGGVAVPLHAGLTASEAEKELRDAAPTALVWGRRQRERARGLVEKVGSKLVEVGGARASGLTPAGVSPDALALVAYTAGTSGTPRGVMLTHANLRANLEQLDSVEIALCRGDVVLCVVPLFHIYGLNVVLDACVRAGATLVTAERFEAQAAAQAVQECGVSVVVAAPPAYVSWLESGLGPEAFARVRAAISGAAPLPGPVLERFRERFGVTIWEGYGLTETAPALTTTAVTGRAKPGSVGRPLPGVELRVVAPEGTDVEPGDPGEIVVRGPNVFAGYWQRPDETARAMRDGWFHTADVGVVDDDGDLFIVDRLRDMVIVSGFNVYPREVEDVLRRHPAVADVAVVGEADERTGERLRAFVVLDQEKATSALDLVAFCREHLAPYKVPRHVEVVEDIPRNAAGKVVRRALHR